MLLPIPFTFNGERQGGEFGRSVAAGDVNGDGLADVVVGAHGFNAGAGFHQGKIYVYAGGRDGFADAPMFTAAGERENDEFGRSFDFGDVNGDGFGDLIVGASGFSSKELQGQGKVYVYLGSSAGLSATPAFTAVGENADDEFGRSVGLADVNGDGFRDLIVGAPGLTKAGASNASPGKMYVFLNGPGGFNATPAFIGWARAPETISGRV